MTEQEWKVRYNDFSGPLRSHAGKELPLNHKFTWNGDTWVALSAYLCGKGLVLDLGKCVEPDVMRSFVDKWKDYEDRDDLPQALENQILEENPVNVDLVPELSLNGRLLKWSGSSGTTYLPAAVMSGVSAGSVPVPAQDCPEDESEPEFCGDEEADAWVRHYSLDASKVWSFHRINFAWTTVCKPKISSMRLRLKEGPHQVYGEPFGPLKPGECVEIVNPKTQESYKLTVLKLEPIEMPKFPVTMRKMEYPRCCMQMNYRIEPEIAQGNLYLNDCAQGDQPVMKEDKVVASVSVIGHADGPTSVFLAGKLEKKEEGRIACSALHFEPVEDVVWQPFFRVDEEDAVVLELPLAEA